MHCKHTASSASICKQGKASLTCLRGAARGGRPYRGGGHCGGAAAAAAGRIASQQGQHLCCLALAMLRAKRLALQLSGAARRDCIGGRRRWHRRALPRICRPQRHGCCASMICSNGQYG